MLRGALQVHSGMNSLFSIIMPTYNRERTIVDSLGSVRQQTHRPVEIIVVGDGSMDETAEVVDRW